MSGTVTNGMAYVFVLAGVSPLAPLALTFALGFPLACLFLSSGGTPLFVFSF